MSTPDTWLDGPLYKATETTTTPAKVLDEALFKLTLAAASLNRAGPTYARKSEALWIFAAGSWARSTYEQMVAEAGKKISPNPAGVWNDIAFAEGSLVEAVMLLRRWGDARDLGDLIEAIEQLQKDLRMVNEGRRSTKLR